MIISQRKMCRESRKIFEFLDDIAIKNGVQGIITPAHIFICDSLVCKFFTQPMLNVITNKLNHIGKKSSKHFEITYWDSIITMMLTDKSASRKNEFDTGNYDVYDVINKLMIVDYSMEDALVIFKIASEYTVAEVEYAYNIAKSAGVYNIQYMKAILEREKAEKQIEITKIDNLTTKIEKSNNLLNTDIRQHSAIDVAIAQYEFRKKIEDYELERKMNELVGGV